MKVVYYVSDVRWGHAARTTLIVKELVRCGVKVIIKTRKPVNFLKTELKEELKKGAVAVIPKEDSGEPGWPPVYPFRKEELIELVKGWLKGWKDNVETEEEFIRQSGASLVISDVSPVALEAAHRAKIPAVAVSNFNWWDEYMYVLEDEELLRPLKEAYLKADWVFLLPLESENSAFRLKERVELVARPHNPDNVRKIRRELIRRYRPEMIAALTTGGFYLPDKEEITMAVKEASRKARILWVVQPTFKPPEDILYHIPEPHLFRDTLASCDFIVAKFGYSTASEALVSRIPMVLLYRSQILEDSLASEELVMAGCAIRFPLGEEFSIPLENLWSISFAGLSKRMQNTGSERIVNRLLERFL